MSQKADFVKMLCGIINCASKLDTIEDRRTVITDIVLPLIYSNERWLLDDHPKFKNTVKAKLIELSRVDYEAAEEWRVAFGFEKFY